MAKWWVNPPSGAPVSYSSEAAAKRAAKSVKGAQVSTSKGPTHTLKPLKGLLAAFKRDKTGAPPPRDKFWR
jgi:hypothetical protein